MDPRPIGCTTHRWADFVIEFYGSSQPNFTELSDLELLVPSTPVGVSGKALRGVTPSFHLSDYKFSCYYY
jgi:hypothetical protein